MSKTAFICRLSCRHAAILRSSTLKKEILRKIAIGDEERKVINLRENAEDKRIEWDVEKEQPLPVEFSFDEMAYLQAACEKISDEELPDDMWGTVEAIYNEISKEA